MLDHLELQAPVARSYSTIHTSQMRFNALIRTHHITSRKKVAVLKKAADRLACHVLLRSGGVPGIMYCQGSEDGVKQWVTIVQVRFK